MQKTARDSLVALVGEQSSVSWALFACLHQRIQRAVGAAAAATAVGAATAAAAELDAAGRVGPECAGTAHARAPVDV